MLRPVESFPFFYCFFESYSDYDLQDIQIPLYCSFLQINLGVSKVLTIVLAILVFFKKSFACNYMQIKNGNFAYPVL